MVARKRASESLQPSAERGGAPSGGEGAPMGAAAALYAGKSRNWDACVDASAVVCVSAVLRWQTVAVPWGPMRTASPPTLNL